MTPQPRLVCAGASIHTPILGVVTRMKTTVEIADSLLAEVKKTAAREGTTVKALLEAGVRRAMAERRSVRHSVCARRLSQVAGFSRA